MQRDVLPPPDAHAEPEGRLILSPTLSIPRGPSELGQSTGPRTTHLKRPVKPLGEFPATGGPQTFFSQGLRQHVFVEREVRHQPFESGIFLFHLAQPASSLTPR